MRSLLFTLGPSVHGTFVSPPRMKFLFAPVLWDPQWPSNPDSLKEFSCCCRNPRLGNLTWGSGLSLLWEYFCSQIIFQFVATHVAGMEFDYTVTALLLVSHCLFVFGCRVYFLVCSNIFCVLSMVVQKLVVIWVFLLRIGELHPSILPSCWSVSC